jgi:hypothetical protein
MSLAFQAVRSRCHARFAREERGSREMTRGSPDSRSDRTRFGRRSLAIRAVRTQIVRGSSGMTRAFRVMSYAVRTQCRARFGRVSLANSARFARRIERFVRDVVCVSGAVRAIRPTRIARGSRNSPGDVERFAGDVFREIRTRFARDSRIADRGSCGSQGADRLICGARFVRFARGDARVSDAVRERFAQKSLAFCAVRRSQIGGA